MKVLSLIIYNIFKEGLGNIFFLILILSVLEALLEVIGLGIFLIFIQKIIIVNQDFFAGINFLNKLSGNKVLFIFIIFFLFKILASYLITLFINFKTSKIYQNLRVDQFKNFIQSDIQNYINLNFGEIMNLIHTDTKTFVDIYFNQSIELLRSLIIITVLILSMLFLNKNVFFSVIPFVILIFIIQSQYLKNIMQNLSKKYRKEFINSQNLVHILVRAIKEIKVFQKENYFIEKLNEVAKNLQKITTRQFIFSSYSKPLIEIIFIFSCSLIFFILKYNNNSAEQIIFYLSGFVFCFIRISPYFNMLSNSYSKINLNYQSLDSFLNSRKKFKKISLNNINDCNNNYEIFQFENYKIQKLFFFIDDNEIFKNSNFEIYKGDKILIYGQSGSGKSTLLEILSGFHNLDRAEVKINNKMIDDKIFFSLKRKICYLPQVVSIIEGSIAENVAFGSSVEKINIHKVKESLTRAGLDEFNKKYDLLNYKLSSNIFNISEGQKKRLSLARGFYHNKEIFLLDELTANLDKDNEEKILKDLILDKTITLVVVSHNEKIRLLFDKSYLILEKNIVFNK
jgi:ABC-type multidrug transport system fused ATPase/permease subunit